MKLIYSTRAVRAAIQNAVSYAVWVAVRGMRYDVQRNVERCALAWPRDNDL